MGIKAGIKYEDEQDEGGKTRKEYKFRLRKVEEDEARV